MNIDVQTYLQLPPVYNDRVVHKVEAFKLGREAVETVRVCDV